MSERIQVLQEGKVVPGQEALFEHLAAREGAKLKGITKRLLEEDPEAWEGIQFDDSDAYWLEEGRQSLISASFRFGCGDMHVKAEVLPVPGVP